MNRGDLQPLYVVFFLAVLPSDVGSVRGSGDLFVGGVAPPGVGALRHFDENGAYIASYLPDFRPARILENNHNYLFFYGATGRGQEQQSGIWKYDIVNDSASLLIPREFRSELAIDRNGLLYASIDNYTIEVFDTSNGELITTVQDTYHDGFVYDDKLHELKLLSLREEPTDLPATWQFENGISSINVSVLQSHAAVQDLNGNLFVLRDENDVREYVSVTDDRQRYRVEGLYLGESFDDRGNLYYADFPSVVRRVSADGTVREIVRASERGEAFSWTLYQPFLGHLDDDNPSLTLRDVTRITREVENGRVRDELDRDQDGRVSDHELIGFFDGYGITVGDADLNGVFDSRDLVELFAAGAYESDTASDWAMGDFDGDRRFASSDLRFALSGGGYERRDEARGAQGVPEPSSLAIWAGIGGWLMLRRKRKGG